MARIDIPRVSGFFRFPVFSLFLAIASGCADDTLYDDDIPTGPGTTVTRLTVAVEVGAADRLELTDSIAVAVGALDGENGEGVVRMGMTAVFLGAAGDTVHVHSDSVVFASPVTGMVTRVFRFAPPNLGGESLPDTLRMEVYGHAVNVAGSCAAATTADGQRLGCRAITGGVVASSGGAQRRVSVLTAGRTFQLPGGGIIADALANIGSVQHLYLSNLTRHRIDVLDLATTVGGAAGQWTSVPVGSEPWGLAMEISGQDLIVANSGGTNISFVAITTLKEDVARRIETPNSPLFEITITTDTLDARRYEAHFYDFSDRPQFIAQDAFRRLLYSTVPTVSAGDGTIRYAARGAGWQQPEVRILFPSSAVSSSPNHWAIAHIDSLRVIITPNKDLVVLYDHVSGFPNQRISSAPRDVADAVAELRAKGSDVQAARGRWRLDEVGFSDTTFVATSQDRRFAAFGEGALSPAGRIMMWSAPDSTVSNEITIADLVSNASERVTGVALNRDGSLGVARGREAAYFFGRDLRLKGMYRDGLDGGAGGAAMTSASAADALAFVATAGNSIRILETTHYLPVGEIEIRDRIVGPLRASAPLPSDNQGLTCPGNPDCVAIKIYGVTSAGGVVIVDVRQRDLAGS